MKEKAIAFAKWLQYNCTISEDEGFMYNETGEIMSLDDLYNIFDS